MMIDGIKKRFPKYWDELIPLSAKASEAALNYPSPLAMLVDDDFDVAKRILSLPAGNLDLAIV